MQAEKWNLGRFGSNFVVRAWIKEFYVLDLGFWILDNIGFRVLNLVRQ